MNPTSTCAGCGKGFDTHPGISETCRQFQTLKNAAREVRRLQKAYFGTRSKEALEAAKRAERELDGILKQA